MIHQLIALALFATVLEAAPLPAVITRYHTAPTVTTTQTYTTGTTTLYLPPVQLFISNGVSYTFTLSNEEWATTPQTRTSIVDLNTGAEGAPAPGTTTSTTAPAQQTAGPAPQPTTEGPSPQPTTESPSPQPTTEGPAPQPTSQTPIASSTASAPAQVSSPSSPSQPTPNAPTSVAISTETPQEPTSSTSLTPISTGTTLSTAVSSSTSSSSSAASPTSSGQITPPSVIVYSPYQDNGSCKDQGTIDSDLEFIFSKGIKKLRIYGTDCNLFTATLPKCSQLGITVNQGVWFTPGQGADSIDGSVQDIIDYGKSQGWSVFDVITVGNEAVNDNVLSVSQLTSKISSVKQQLNNNGYNGHITTSEPPVSFTRHPELCNDSEIDIVGINPHSYFDPSVDASQAGSFVAGQKKLVEAVCGSKQVVITETGYPSQGDLNGANQPSPENQQIAIKAILDSTGGDVTILTTYNDFWKHPGPHGIEQYFGTIQLFS
ncbi:glycoside hydrolase family 17 protein [Suhomyces tanzawaensis NRRL Y-17324]|uniref:Glycoside hydrolase family 17 protein n=1 Tax=Suhomyces tanzawaensis NRRL Y-17324 TaxID=984487 RepID=A0A1E4SPP4_9ASCO|nr:glycoside hydrolase family 17 protein [Suhomyces tanzawaensis NRRL Y-17324]ODV81458.1 glycoside hydrolase family 17 protein [Suhomyces tanzawaensis NRRL Y-17324]